MSVQMSSILEYVEANLPALASDVAVIQGTREGESVEVDHLEVLANMLYPAHRDSLRAAQDLVVKISLRLATASEVGEVYKQHNNCVCTHL